MEILQLKEVTKEFDKKIILDRISFSIEEGDIFGIIGQSGSGKSTLLNLLIGFYEPSEGKIIYQPDANKKPKEVHKQLSVIRKEFGFASQVSSFYPKLTLKENLLHFGQLYDIKKKTLKNNVDNLLEFTCLAAYKDQLAEHISVGMQKRLDLSCSLIHKPKILILDEPTANLDPLLQKEILHLIQQANRQGITIIIASHHLNEIEQICNKVALIHQGKIKMWGTIEEVKKPYLVKESTIHLRAGEQHQRLVEQIRNLPVNRIIDTGNSVVLYSTEIQNTLHQVINISQQKKITLQEIDVRKPSLQEVFETIVQDKEEKTGSE